MSARRAAWLVVLLAAGAWFVAATVLIPVRVTFGGGSLRCGTVLHPDRRSEIGDVCPRITAKRLPDVWPTTAIFGAAAGALFLVGHRAWRRRGVVAPLLAGGAGLGWLVITGFLLMWITGAHAAPGS